MFDFHTSAVSGRHWNAERDFANAIKVKEVKSCEPLLLPWENKTTIPSELADRQKFTHTGSTCHKSIIVLWFIVTLTFISSLCSLSFFLSYFTYCWLYFCIPSTDITHTITFTSAVEKRLPWMTPRWNEGSKKTERGERQGWMRHNRK